MPAHLRDLSWKCVYPGCGSNATVQLYNTVNAPLGQFCRTHGRRMLDGLEREDQARMKAGAAGHPENVERRHA